MAVARRGACSTCTPAAHDAESFEVAVEAAASVTARLVRLRRRVEVVTSAGEVLGTGGDPRHDVIDRSPPSAPTSATGSPTVLENLRAHRRVDLVVAILGRVAARHAARARRARRHRRGRRAHPARPPSRRPRSVVVVDASADAVRRPPGTRRSPARRSRRASTSPWHARARFVAPFALAALSAVAALVARPGRRLRPLRRCPCSAPRSSRTRSARSVRAARLVGVGRRRASRSSALAVFVRARARAVDHHARDSRRGDTWHALDRQLTGGWHLLRTAPAPAPATDGAILLAVLAVWCMAAIADWLAFATPGDARRDLARARVLRVDVDARHQRLARRCSPSGSASTAGAFLLAQNLAVLDRRRSWLVSQQAARPHWLAPAALLGVAARRGRARRRARAPGRRLRPAPRLRQRRPRRLRRAAATGPSLAPFVDIGAQARRRRRPGAVHRAGAQPDYWRIAALDQYSGDERRPVDAERARATAGAGRAAERRSPVARCEQQFAIGPLGERWLPAAYRPVAIGLDDTLVVRSSGTLVADAGERAATSTTRSRPTLPPLAGTRVRRRSRSAATARAGARRPSRRTPSSPDARRSTRSSRPRRADRRRRRRDHARTRRPRPSATTSAGPSSSTTPASTASTTARPSSSSSATKRGFCVQFASAYAVMARTLGIPARVAVGLHPRRRDVDGTLPRRPATTRTRGPRST